MGASSDPILKLVSKMADRTKADLSPAWYQDGPPIQANLHIKLYVTIWLFPVVMRYCRGLLNKVDSSVRTAGVRELNPVISRSNWKQPTRNPRASYDSISRRYSMSENRYNEVTSMINSRENSNYLKINIHLRRLLRARGRRKRLGPGQHLGHSVHGTHNRGREISLAQHGVLAALLDSFVLSSRDLDREDLQPPPQLLESGALHAVSFRGVIPPGPECDVRTEDIKGERGEGGGTRKQARARETYLAFLQLSYIVINAGQAYAGCKSCKHLLLLNALVKCLLVK